MKLVAMLFAGLGVGLGCALGGTEMITASAMRKFSRDEIPAGRLRPVELAAMRNEHELFQVLFRAGAAPVKRAEVTVSALHSDSGAAIDERFITIRLAHYLHCEKALETPQWLPDALPRCPASFEVPAGQNQAVYVDIRVPADAAPGIYRGTVRLRADGVNRSVPLTLRVHDLELGARPGYSSAFAIWPEMLAAPYPGLTANSPEIVALHRRLYDFLTAYRLPPTDLPVPLDSPEAEAYFGNPAIRAFRIPYDPAHPEKLVALCDLLRRKGELHKGYIYTLDELPPEKHAEAAAYADRIHQLVPDVRYLLTVNTGVASQLVGKINIWSPILSGYEEKFFADRQRAGDQVWWYTCVFPQMPYPTYLINDSGVSPRILNWLQARYGVEGNLYWAVNIWKKYDGTKYLPRDCWNDPLAFPGGNGDGFLVYPPRSPAGEPVPSLRLEMIRQGNEDFELLTLLKARLTAAAALLRQPDFDVRGEVTSQVGRVARELTDFTHDPTVVEAVRRDLLEEAENLGSPQRALIYSSQPQGEVAATKPVSLQVAAAPGSRIAVTAQPAIPVTPRDGGGWLLTVSRPVRVEIAVTAEGRTARYYRNYEPRKPENRGRELFLWSDPKLPGKFRLDHVELFAVPGSIVKGFRFLPGTAFSSLWFPVPDSAPYSWIRVRAANPGDRDLSCVMKFHSDARALDGNFLNIPAHGRKTLVFPFNHPDTRAPFHTIQIWKNVGSPEEAGELAVESISLHREKPRRD